MNVHLEKALGAVKLALGDTAQRAAHRRLQVYQDKISCKAGCNHCCSHQIHITIAEATIILGHLREIGQWNEVKERARAQFKAAQEIEPIAWFKMNIKCPVLDKNGMCGAYPVRPAICSTHFVTSDPDGCDPWSTKPVQYESANMQDLYEEFQRRLEAGIAGHGIMSLSVPIAVALLLAERIQLQTNLELSDVVSLLYNEFK